MDFIENYVGLTHFIIVIALMISMIFIYKLFNKINFKNIIISLVIVELVVFYSYLFISGDFSFQEHLPIEMCYLTQISILFYLLFDIKAIKPFLFFNAISGAIAGYLSTNMTANDHFIYHFHHYLAHSTLLIFFLYLLHKKYKPTMEEFFRSIIINYGLLVSIVIFNTFCGTNYWFTQRKPSGANLTLLFPDWPGYLIVMICIGLVVYTGTYILSSKNFENEQN